jgi:S-adenosylmethionine:tRNA ribosyltransferase-isomerase
MIFADRPHKPAERLCSIDADGNLRHFERAAFATALRLGDLVVANDAATLPASLGARHDRTGSRLEIRLAGWARLGDPTRFVALALGAGDHRIRTEERGRPPRLVPGDSVSIGPLTASVEGLFGHPRLFGLRFHGSRAAILAGLARHGRPIQYSHVPAPLALWDVWTPIAGQPVAFEPPSAGFALDWRLLADLRRRGVGFATVTHAAGISSTGDPRLDLRLPLDEHYRIPGGTAAAIDDVRAQGGRVVAIGTTVVRALEAAAAGAGVRPGGGIASGRIGPGTRLRVADAIVTGVHFPGDSHFELLRAFADDIRLRRLTAALEEMKFRSHEFGDVVMIERDRRDRPLPGDRVRDPISRAPDQPCGTPSA